MNRLNLKFISEFDSSPTGPSIVEWFDKEDHVCRMFKVKEGTSNDDPIEIFKKGLCHVLATWGWSGPGKDKVHTVCSFCNRLISCLEMIHWTAAQPT